MRIKSNFGEKKALSQTRETEKFYFLVFEGEETEVQYFEGLKDNREELNLNSSIKIVHLLRSFKNKSVSNPEKILMDISKKVEQNNNDTISSSDLAEQIINFLGEKKFINTTNKVVLEAKEKDIATIIENHFSTELKKNNLDNIIKSIGNELLNMFEIETSINEICDYLELQNLTYDENVDKIIS